MRARDLKRQEEEARRHESRCAAFVLGQVAERGLPDRYRFFGNTDRSGRAPTARLIAEGGLIDCYWDRGPWSRGVRYVTRKNLVAFKSVMAALDLEPDYNDLSRWLARRRRAWREFLQPIGCGHERLDPTRPCSECNPYAAERSALAPKT